LGNDPAVVKKLFDEIAPRYHDYAHNQRWWDGNGYSHLRAALLKASLTIPFVDRQLILGEWQAIAYVDFDNRPRQRSLIVQIIGE
jgi:secondary thiamine-phosphate synthase enzyme